jgi:aryl-alcohol dehydrogenase-like predicted oxidoreductase
LVDNICIGTAQFGMLYGIANKSGQPGTDEVLSIVKLASENNVWFYDTAQAYGDSENLLGKAFSQLRINDRVRCITKIQPNMKDRDVATLIQSVRQSMRKLQVSQLWGILAHRVEQVRDPITLKAVDRMKDEGLVKWWGASVYNPKDAMKLTRDDAIDIIQAPFNILDRRLLDCGFFRAAREYGKKVFLRSIFLQGLLFLEAEELSEKDMKWAEPHLEHFRNRINALKVSVESFAMQAVSTVVPDGVMIMGIEKTSQLEKNLSTLRSPLIAKVLVDNWWKNLPDYPERFLNPSLW